LKVTESFPASLPSLVADYLGGNPVVEPFFQFNPNMEGLKKAASERIKHPIDRTTLVESLLTQIRDSIFATDTSIQQIYRLKDSDVVTVATGHQLCMYGGPLFFFYKILSTIALADQLNSEGINAVPVYWMASEDHDFEEINHIYLGGKRVEWKTDQKGPVGRILLKDSKQFKDQVRTLLKDDKRYSETLNQLDEIFEESKTLAHAVRDFVYAAFSQLGLIVIDADQPELKRLFAPHVKRELLESFSDREVGKMDQLLINSGFKTQVHSREVNLFWMENGCRERIVKTASGFETSDNQFSWTENELLQLLESNPENFSPNVILRPLYQEVILPNIAYIGGPGETSYWLQLRGVFESAKVPMPVVLLRDMAFITNDLVEKKLRQLGLSYSDLSRGLEEIFTQLVRKGDTHEDLVSEIAHETEKNLNELTAKMNDLSRNLGKSASTESVRILKRLKTLEKKVFRFDKSQQSILSDRLGFIFSHYQPNDEPQERHDNWLNHFSELLQATQLQSGFNPLENQMKIFQLGRSSED
jgi:bacillithiol synthase